MHRSIMIGRFLASLAALCAIASAAVACPNCKETLSDPQNLSIARGYFYSILFMMSMPFAILGTFGSFAYLSIRRARRQQESGGDESSSA